jgi:hypothetical protein
VRRDREASWSRWCGRFLVASGAFGFACGGSTSDIDRALTTDGDAATGGGTGGRAPVTVGGAAGRVAGGTGAGGVSTGGHVVGGAAMGGAATGGVGMGGGTSMDASVTGGAPTEGGATGGVPGVGDASIDQGSTFTPCLQAAPVGLPPASGLYLVAGTDFVTTTEVVAIDLATRKVVGRTQFAYGEIFPIASGGRGFILEREKGALNVLTPTGTVARRILLGAADGAVVPLAPQDVVMVPGESTAYVSLRDANSILIVDVDAGVVTGSIDISAFMAPGDADGKVDAGKGFFDPAFRRVYFTLSRGDRTTMATPPYLLACPSHASMLIGIDTGTNGFVMGLGLDFVDPVDVAFDPGRRRAVIVGSGCFEDADGGQKRVRHGVESANIDTMSSTILATQSESQAYDRVMVLADGTVIAGQINGLEWRRVSTLGRFGCSYTSIGFFPVIEQGDVVLSLAAYVAEGNVWELLRGAVFSSSQDQPMAIPFTKPPYTVSGVAIVR